MTKRTFRERLKRRGRLVAPPPNPLRDPIAHIKRPLRALNRGRVRAAGGEAEVRPGQSVLEFTPADVVRIRTKFLATQKEFAGLIGISAETLRTWERGRRRPHGPSRALLRAIDADPAAVARALNWHARDFSLNLVDWLGE
jgi:DNA-binding transcriptional regulator YdaS (Cro superfamily)